VESALDPIPRDLARTLSDWLSFLAQSLPLRAVPTFLELLCACLISPTGFLTQALCSFPYQRHWSTYYFWLESARWSWLALARQTTRLLCSVLKRPRFNIIIDDTLVPRSSKKAPGVATRHEHSNKPNRPRFLNAQCWVIVALVARRPNGKTIAVPLLSRLMRTPPATRGKLFAARALLRVLRPCLPAVRVLMDSWYMRRILLFALLAQDCTFIGQVRKDTALYLPPVRIAGKRGRPPRYGIKLTPEQVQQLPSSTYRLKLYGQTRTVLLRSALVLARFLKGRRVRAVWCQFVDEKTGQLSPTRLILASETRLRPTAVLTLYAQRWDVEPLLNQLKHPWGMREAWQQTHQVLSRWMQLRSLAYTLTQLLTLTVAPCLPLAQLAPWRRVGSITAGLMRAWLQRHIVHFNPRRCWNSKSRKFALPLTAFDRPDPQFPHQRPAARASHHPHRPSPAPTSPAAGGRPNSKL